MQRFSLKYRLSLLIVLLAQVALSAQIEILYRPRPTTAQIDALAQRLFGVAQFRSLSNEQRRALTPYVDPLPFGHVALRIPGVSEGSVIGWVPIADEVNRPLDMNDLRGVEASVRRLFNPSPDGNFPSVPGRFVNNERWAEGGELDPTQSIVLTVTDAQIDIMVRTIREMNDSGRYFYQLKPNEVLDAEGNTVLKFPQWAFNCLVAVKRVLQSAGVETPFDLPEGSMKELMRIAARHANLFNDPCHQMIQNLAYGM